MASAPKTKTSANVHPRKAHVIQAVPAHKAVRQKQLRLLNISIGLRHGKFSTIHIESD